MAFRFCLAALRAMRALFLVRAFSAPAGREPATHTVKSKRRAAIRFMMSPRDGSDVILALAGEEPAGRLALLSWFVAGHVR
jgi:hypothetical protein